MDFMLRKFISIKIIISSPTPKKDFQGFST